MYISRLRNLPAHPLHLPTHTRAHTHNHRQRKLHNFTKCNHFYYNNCFLLWLSTSRFAGKLSLCSSSSSASSFFLALVLIYKLQTSLNESAVYIFTSKLFIVADCFASIVSEVSSQIVAKLRCVG